MMNNLSCPLCSEELFKTNNTYRCTHNHCFDISSSGYVNLCVHHKGQENSSGDSREMVLARNDFLNKDYYKALKNGLCDVLGKYPCNEPTIIDCGCGEGYYTASMGEYLYHSNRSFNLLGFDISKTAIQKASKRTKNVFFAVASVFSLPIMKNSADILFSLFAPIAEKEFFRVLKPNGLLFIVAPAKRHLYSLKELLYEKPYYNEEKAPELEGFSLIDTIRIEDKIILNNNLDIKNLFLMTPYFWKTSVEASQKLAKTNFLETELEFIIYTLKKD